MIERIALAGQSARSAHDRRATKLAKVLAHTRRPARLGGAARQIVEIYFDIPRYEKIQFAIAVIVTPGGAGAPALARHAELFRHVSKRAIAVVVIETRDPKVCDIEIGPAVVVVIADGHTHSPTLVGHASFIGHVFELPISQI